MSRIAELQHSIKVHSQDLQDELAALVRWEDEMQRKNRSAITNVPTSDRAYSVPVRGAPLEHAQPPKATQASVGNVAEVAKEQGNEYFRKGMYQDALRMYTKGIDANPVGEISHVLYGNRSMCNLKLSLWQDAERDATKSLDLDRTYTKAYFRRAQARKHLGLLREARKDLEAVLSFNPSDAETVRELKAITLLLREKENKVEVKPRKKLVIEEVDDDGSDTPDTCAQPSGSASAPIVQPKPTSQPLRLNSNVEELDDEDPNPTPTTKVVSQKSAPIVETSASPQCAEPVVHPISSVGVGPLPPKKTRERTNRVDVSVPPTSFSEFERTYMEIDGDAALIDAYFSQVDTSAMSSLFGVSLTSEIFCDWMQYCIRQSPEVAFQALKGLSEVRRIGELTMFLSDDEEQFMRRAIQHASSSGHDLGSVLSAFG